VNRKEDERRAAEIQAKRITELEVAEAKRMKGERKSEATLTTTRDYRDFGTTCSADRHLRLAQLLK